LRVEDLGCTFKVAHGGLVRSFALGPHRVLNPVHLAAAARDCANVPVTHHPRRYGASGWSFGGSNGRRESPSSESIVKESNSR
jgi:hypothetical protein